MKLDNGGVIHDAKLKGINGFSRPVLMELLDESVCLFEEFTGFAESLQLADRTWSRLSLFENWTLLLPTDSEYTVKLTFRREEFGDAVSISCCFLKLDAIELGCKATGIGLEGCGELIISVFGVCVKLWLSQSTNSPPPLMSTLLSLSSSVLYLLGDVELSAMVAVAMGTVRLLPES